MKNSTLSMLSMLLCLVLGFSLSSEAQVYIVGSGTSVTGSGTGGTGDTPFGTWYMDDQTQMLYLASELSASGAPAGFMNAIGFNVTQVGSPIMQNFNIKIGFTSATSISSLQSTVSYVTVYSSSAYQPTMGWNTFNFSSPILWNGSDNVVVDVCFDNSSYSNNSHTTADFLPGRVACYYTDNSSGPICGLYGGYSYNYRSQAAFTILSPYADDAGIGSILSPSLPTCDLDSVDIQVVVINAGTDTLTSCDIKWQIGNGTPTTYSFSGAVAPQGGVDTVTIANYSFTNFDELTIWTENPNGAQDSLPQNDTLSMVLATGLSGTYNIPNDFATLTAAATALNTFGVCDDVVMEINSGIYTEQVILGEILGTSADATVRWTSASGNMNDVVIQYSSGSTVNLEGSDWITFDHLTIRSTSAFSGIGVELELGAENNTFDHCDISTGSGSTTSSAHNAFRSVGNNHNLTVTNCSLRNGGYGLFVQGSGTTSRVENLVFENNTIKNAYYLQTYLYYIDGFEFNNNVITNDTNMYLFAYGLYMYYVDNFNVIGNYIGADATYSGSSLYGGYAYPFYMYYCLGTQNPRSKIANNCVTAGRPGAIYYGYYGLYMSQCGILDLEHNSFSKVGGYSGYYGAYITGGGQVAMRNNSFLNYLSGHALYAPGQWTITDSDHNNYYSNGGTLVYFGTTNYSTLEDYQNGSGNDMNSVSTDPAYLDTLACITCNDTLDAAGMVGTMYDIDSNMRSMTTPDIGPKEWVSPATFTLGGDSTYCADEVTLEAGPAQSVTWSVNGNSSSAPTITLSGGSTATTYNVLVSIQTQYCGSASDNALITLVPNAHLDSNVHICAGATATLNPGGLASGSYTWSTGQTTQSIVVGQPGNYTVTKDVQGCVSTATANVTQSEAVQILGTEVCSDDLPLTLDATIANGVTYAWSGGASPNTATNNFSDAGAYTVSATDAFGCTSVDSFEVVILEEPDAVISIQSTSGTIYIFDASASSFLTASSLVTWNFGAGAVPATSNNVVQTVTYPWGNPSNPTSYSVSLEINNGCGVDITTQIVTPDPLSVEELAEGEFAIFPNPANDVVTIATNAVDAGSIQILDMSGRVVVQAPMSAGSNNHEINISSLSAGAYIVKVATDANTQMQQLIVQ